MKNEDYSAIYLAAGAGLLMMFVLNSSSSFITNDDYFSRNSASLYKDGRFLAGPIYNLIRNAFGSDVVFRHLMAFIMGSISFFSFRTIAGIVMPDKRAILFSGFAIASFGAAEYMFFYDIVPIYYIVTLPIISEWSVCFKRYVDNPTRRQGFIFLAVTTLCMVVILAIFQVIFYLPFLLLAAFLFLSTGEAEKSVFRACFVAALGFTIALIATQLFTRSHLYIDWFGYELRERASITMIGDGTLGGFISAWVREVAHWLTYQGNTIALHAFLLGFIFLCSLRKPGSKHVIFALKFLLLLICLWLSPFLLFKEMVENPRVMTTLYAYGSIALFLIAFAIVDNETPDQIFKPQQSILITLILLAISAIFLSPATRVEIYASLLLLFFTALAIPKPSRHSPVILLSLAVLTFTSVELWKSYAITDRYEKFATVDDLMFSKLNEAILNNLYLFNSKHVDVEFGVRKEGPTRGSFRSFSYSTTDYWRERLWQPSLVTFKRNDKICTDLGAYEVFKIVESGPGILKFCI